MLRALYKEGGDLKVISLLGGSGAPSNLLISEVFSFRRLGEEGACWKLGNNCPVSIFNIPLFNIK